MELFDRIKELCSKRGTTIKQIESELGYGNGSLSKSNNNIKAERLQQLADYFGVSMDYLMNGDTQKEYYINPDTARLAQELHDNPDLHLVFDACRDATPDDLRKIVEMIKVMRGW